MNAQSRRAGRIPLAAVLAIVVVAMVSLPADAAGPSEIGHATAIKTSVSGVIDGRTAGLADGDPVYQDQEIKTDASGIGEFIFRDETHLAIGPGSSVVLDSFVYDESGSVREVAIGIAKGTLRFLTGKSAHDAYVIKTPTATIGVRGTAFDLYADGNGEVAIAMIDGEVEVCPRGGQCRLHSLVGRFLHLTRDGIFSLHERWDGTFLRDVSFAAALPFMAAQDALSPRLRAGAAIARRYTEAAGDAVEDVGRSIRDRLDDLPTPRLRVPRPFR
jgi:hypothetical protein